MNAQNQIEVLHHLAEPLFRYRDYLASQSGDDPSKLAAQSATLLDKFESDGAKAGLEPSSLAAARYGIIVLLDLAARRNRAISVKTWSSAAHSQLFQGRDINLDGLRNLQMKAESFGPDYQGLAQFLNDCCTRAEKERYHPSKSGPVVSGRLIAIASAVLVLIGLVWAGSVEWRFHQKLLPPLDQFESSALSRFAHTPGALAIRLDALANAATAIHLKAAQSPLGILHRIEFLGAGQKARRRYRSVVDQTLPNMLLQAIDTSLASQGDGLELYDTLRAWSVISGQSAFQKSYVKGWVEDHPDLMDGLGNLAPHVDALTAPQSELVLPDPEVFGQAQQFAAEANEAKRAYLELRRSQPVTDLSSWSPSAEVDGLDFVIIRRSGRPMADPIPGIFTLEGWNYARDFGAGLAVQETRKQAHLLLSGKAEQLNDAPDRLLETLQINTLAHWKTFLQDLRIKPFTDHSDSIAISGRLGSRQSPLIALLKSVWVQVGGLDRNREHRLQLLIATNFAATIQYVETGKMQDISRLFAALNVALAALGGDFDTNQQRLLDVQARARSVATFRQAPVLVVQIVEDVITQAGLTTQEAAGGNPALQQWRKTILPQCQRSLHGRYPIGNGPDVDLREFAGLFAPGGNLDRFFRLHLAPLVDTGQNPWRLRPEARFAGFSPQTAVFFQKVAAVRAAYFGPGGEIDTALTLAALAEKGQAAVLLGGQRADVRTSGVPAQLHWPGPIAQTGMVLTLKSQAGTEVMQQAGVWGLMRLLDSLRLRQRDNGRRFLIDFKFEKARLFVEMSFEQENNPISRRGLLKGLICPSIL